MKHQKLIFLSLENAPLLLEELINTIPSSLYKKRRINDSWSIQEWCCHLIDSQDFLLERFAQIDKSPETIIKAHLPDFTEIRHDYLAKDISSEIQSFFGKRKKMLSLLKSFDDPHWEKPAKHEEYEPFNSYSLLRHVMLVDHIHLFQIEKLWLTKDQYL